MHVGRALCTVAGLALAAAPAAAQTLPDDGPRDQIELVSGTAIAGAIKKLYYAKSAQEGAEWAGLIVERAEDVAPLWVPRATFSAATKYWWNRRLWFPSAVDREIFGMDKDAPDPAPAALDLFILAQQALWAGPGTWAQAQGHYEHAVKIAETDDDSQTDPKVYQEHYVKNLNEYGLWISPKDGRWVDWDAFNEARGWVKWRGEWYPPEEAVRLKAEASAGAKRSLEGMVDKPDEYPRVHLGVVRAFPGTYQPDKKGEWPKVRFFARYAAAPEEKFTPLPGAPWKSPEFQRLRVIHDDCAHVYLAAKNQKLIARAKALEPGDAVELFGRMIVWKGIVLLECDGMALR